MNRTLMCAQALTRLPPGGALTAMLAGQGSGVVRSAGPADADRIRDFVCGLSPQSQYFRFFASVAPPSSGLLRALCGQAGTGDVLILTNSRGIVIGHGMAADDPAGGGHTSNIGLAIADDWQGQGLGTMLLSVLVGRAAARGITSLVLDVLPANDRMRGIVSRHWPDAPMERTRDSLVIRPAISPALAAGARQLPAAIALSRDAAAPGQRAGTSLEALRASHRHAA